MTTAIAAILLALIGVGLSPVGVLAASETPPPTASQPQGQSQSQSQLQPQSQPQTEALFALGKNSFAEWDKSPGWITFSEGTEEETFVYTAMGIGRASVGDISWQDYTLETNYKIYQFGQWGVLRVYIRYQGPYQGYGLNILPNEIQLVRFDGRWDQVKVLGRQYVSTELNKVYNLRFTVSGYRLQVFRDNRILFSVVDRDALYPGGGVSFGPEAIAVVISGTKVTGTRIDRNEAERLYFNHYVDAWEKRRSEQNYPGFLPPGVHQPYRPRHIVLTYNGVYSGDRGNWTIEDALPYVAYVDTEGRPQDWFFDSILILGLATASGGTIGGGAPGSTIADWKWYLDRLFTPGVQLDAFEAAVEQAGQVLGDPDHRLNVILMIPHPWPDVQNFGDVDGDGESENFSQQGQSQAAADAARMKAVRWYIEEVQRRWAAKGYRHLQLAGFYWVYESLDGFDQKLVPQVSDYIHSLPGNLALYWIPWFNAPGHERAKDLGLDYTMMQPNYMFLPQVPKTRFAETAERAEKYHLGIEIESEDWVLTSAAARERYFDYLRAGKQIGFMEGALLSYYQGVKVMAESARSTDPEVRRVYDATYEFVTGRFGETLFPVEN